MNNIITIMKKEFARFFGDKRMVLSALILPGLMIYLVYSLMGNALGNMLTTEEGYVPSIYVYNLPASIEAVATSTNVKIDLAEANEIDDLKTRLADKTIDLLVIFPTDFDAKVAAYDSKSGEAAPNVQMLFNSTKTESQSAYTLFGTLLDSYEKTMANKFDINAVHEMPEDGSFDYATKEDTSAMVFSSMLPMLMTIFLFSGCMAIAPESIAGEKERGTIATLLVTPLGRGQLALGKLFSLSILALLSGISSFTGTILSLPKLMGSMDNVDAGIYGVTEYGMLILTVLSTVLLLVGLIAVISAFAKTVKEAGMLVMPLMVVVMLVGVSAMFGGGAKTDAVYYLIPIYNSVQAMSGIFSFSYDPINIYITFAANFVYAGIFSFLLTRMFNSERVIFSK